jgi:hypothetical protein
LVRCCCGHSREEHEHLRVGSECAVCTCGGWRRSLPWREQVDHPLRGRPGVDEYRRVR